MIISGFGNALIDIEIIVSEEDILNIDIPKGGMRHIKTEERDHFLDKFKDSEAFYSPGGSIANSLDAASLFKADTHFSCSLGDDVYSKQFLSSFSNTTTNFNFSKKPTGLCFIFITPDGERTMAASLDANYDLTPECLDADALKNSNALLFDAFSITTDNGFRAVQEAVNIANNHGTEIIFGLADRSLVVPNVEKIKWLLNNNISLIAGNQQEVETLKSSVDVSSNKLLTSMGPLGVQFDDIKVNATQLHPVSTNGAGDALLGVFLARKDLDGTREALEKAVQFAGLVCMKKGPRIKNAT
jgi:sugar/nucleoside kinase (ribokinase family)